MKYKKLENIRKKYFPINIILIVFTYLLILSSVVLLIVSAIDTQSKKRLIIYLSTLSGLIILIFFMVYLVYFIQFIFNKKIIIEYKNLILVPIVKKYNYKIVDNNDLDKIIYETSLFKSYHKINVLYSFQNNGTTIFEFRKKSLFSFNGIFLKTKTDFSKDFIIKNLSYFYKDNHRNMYSFKKNDYQNFSNRFKIYLKTNENIHFPKKFLENLYFFTIAYKLIGIEVKNGYLYLFLSKEKPLMMPNINEKIDVYKVSKLEKEFIKIEKIKQLLLNIENQ